MTRIRSEARNEEASFQKILEKKDLKMHLAKMHDNAFIFHNSDTK